MTPREVQWKLLRPHPPTNSITAVGLSTISAVLRGSLPRPSKLGHRLLTLTALCSWTWCLLLTQTPSARPSVSSVLCVEPARPPAGPGSTAVTPHLAVPSQDGICQLSVLGLWFLHMELQDILLLPQIGHHRSVQVFLHSDSRVPSWLLKIFAFFCNCIQVIQNSFQVLLCFSTRAHLVTIQVQMRSLVVTCKCAMVFLALNRDSCYHALLEGTGGHASYPNSP